MMKREREGCEGYGEGGREGDREKGRERGRWGEREGAERQGDERERGEKDMGKEGDEESGRVEDEGREERTGYLPRWQPDYRNTIHTFTFPYATDCPSLETTVSTN